MMMMTIITLILPISQLRVRGRLTDHVTYYVTH